MNLFSKNSVGMTLLLLREKYQATCAGQPYQYAQFCVFYRQYSSRLKLSMQQTTRLAKNCSLTTVATAFQSLIL